MNAQIPQRRQPVEPEIKVEVTDTVVETVAPGAALSDRQRDYAKRVRDSDMIEGWWWDSTEFRPRPDQPVEPGGPAVPHLWSWSTIGPLINESGEVVGLGQGPGEAERRVLVLRNPGLTPQYAMTNTFFGDIQLIEPGEVAPSHRHTTTAARFVFEGTGGWTSVEGERVDLDPGDIVLNPQWAWHDHGNDGRDNFVFFDVLDIPLLTHLGTAVWDFDYVQVTGDKSKKKQPLTRPDNQCMSLFDASGIVPRFVSSSRADQSALLGYRYATVRGALNKMKDERGSPHDGIIVELNNPESGASIAPTMSMCAQLMRPGEKTLSHRHNWSTIYIAIDGRGRTVVDDTTIEWEKNDIFVVPSWRWHEHSNRSEKEDAVLYSVSDLPVIEKLGLRREQRRTESGDLEDTGWAPNRSVWS